MRIAGRLWGRNGDGGPPGGALAGGGAVGEDPVEAAQALSEAIDRVLERGRSADVERSTFAQRRYSWSEAANRYVALFSDLARTDVRPASSCRPGAAGVAEGACAP